MKIILVALALLVRCPHPPADVPQLVNDNINRGVIPDANLGTGPPKRINVCIWSMDRDSRRTVTGLYCVNGTTTFPLTFWVL